MGKGVTALLGFLGCSPTKVKTLMLLRCVGVQSLSERTCTCTFPLQ